MGVFHGKRPTSIVLELLLLHYTGAWVKGQAAGHSICGKVFS
jgi:heme A synthase